MKIYLGADHGGFEMKEKLKVWLQEKGYDVIDVGAHTLDPQDDYPEFSFAVAEGVATENSDEVKGIIACRSGAGVAIAANKVKGIRAVTVYDELSAERAKSHNNANVICLAGDWLKEEQTFAVVEKFLTTPFNGEERHVRRINQIAAKEQ